jgi:prefoldin subunit 5
MNKQRKKVRTIRKRCRVIIRKIDELRKELAALKNEANGLNKACRQAKLVIQI